MKGRANPLIEKFTWQLVSDRCAPSDYPSSQGVRQEIKEVLLLATSETVCDRAPQA